MNKIFEENRLHLRVLCFLTTNELITVQAVSKSFLGGITVLEECWRSKCEHRWRDKHKNRLRTASKTSTSAAIQRATSLASGKTATIGQDSMEMLLPTSFFLFRELTSSKLVPRGTYTDKHNLVFGYGSSSNCKSWLMLGHTPDCRSRPFPALLGSQDSFEIRLCIQNIRDSNISIPLHLEALAILGGDSHSSCERPLQVLDFKCVAINGDRITPVSATNTTTAAVDTATAATTTVDGIAIPAVNTPSEFIVLPQYSFAVFSIRVASPAEVENEAELLLAMKSISIRLQIDESCAESTGTVPPVAPDGFPIPHSPSPSSSYPLSQPSDTSQPTSGSVVVEGQREGINRFRYRYLVTNIVAESEVWTHYSELPRGAVLLKRDCPGSVFT